MTRVTLREVAADDVLRLCEMLVATEEVSAAMRDRLAGLVVEDWSPDALEALRAVGASWFQAVDRVHEVAIEQARSTRSLTRQRAARA